MQVDRLLPLLLLGGCVSTSPVPSVGAGPPFDVERFFTGGTEGRGTLKVAFSSDQQIMVQGSGRLEPDGTLVLDQRVERTGEQPQQRQWRIRRTAPGQYAGTLTDAQGPVTGTVRGNRLELRFRMKRGGLDAQQWLVLQPGGRSALNRMRISKFGVLVAALEETIVKVD